MRQGFSVCWALALVASSSAIAHESSITSLPVGDGRWADHPKAGSVYVCRSEFRQGGARHHGDWIQGDTWYPLEKVQVQGSVMWPEAYLEMTEQSDALSIETNGLPIDQPTGTFPIAKDDPAYQFDTNPNPIEPISLAFNIPVDPVKADEPGCLPMGMIGFTVTGVAFYNALDDAGLDAAAHEVQDLCHGHPQGKGQYHYHSSSPCLPGSNSNSVVGWALDGYPILGMRDEDGELIENADLDACHGRAEEVSVDGRTYDYAYRLTPDYPYVMTCFTGVVLPETRQSIRQAMGPPIERGKAGRPLRR